MQQVASSTLDSVLTEAKSLVGQLLLARCSEIAEIPKTQGVYVIYDKAGGIIYIGKGKNLKRRICDDHRGGDQKISTSTFRRAINRLHGIAAGRPLRDWVRSSCSFAFVEIPDPDLCSAVEALTIRVLRKEGSKLLNAV